MILRYTQYRSNLKKKIEATFPDQLHFVTAKANTPEIVLNANKVSAYVAGTNEVTLTKIIIAVL